jgi:sugar-specific transcriptional regulator TrmB
MSLGLDSLDLDSQESKLYIILLAYGPQSVGELIKNTELSSSDIMRSLEGLKKKGYAHEIPGIATRYHGVLPFQDLKKSGEKAINEIETLAVQIDQHVAEKMETIVSTMRKELEQMTGALIDGQTMINQAETKSETAIEELVAKSTLDIEQVNESAKKTLQDTIKEKQKDHQTVISNLGTAFTQKASTYNDKFQATNKELVTKYSEGLEELKTAENTRIDQMNSSSETLTAKTQENLSQGIQEVHTTMDNTGKVLFSSLDKQKEMFEQKVTETEANFSDLSQGVSSEGKQNVTATLQAFQTGIVEKIEASRQKAVETFKGSQDGITQMSDETSKNIRQILNDILANAQGRVEELFQNTQAELNTKITEAKNQVETSVTNFSEMMNNDTKNNFQAVIANTETTLTGLVQDTSNTLDKTSSEVDGHYQKFESDTRSQIENLRTTSLNSLNQSISDLKIEIESQIKEFTQAMKPHESFFTEELARFKTDFQSSQTQSLSGFQEKLESFKQEVEQRNQALEQLVKAEMDSLKQSVQASTTELGTLFQNYDDKYEQILVGSATKASESLITKIRELQEKTVQTVNEMTKTAVTQLNDTNKILSDGIHSEIATLEAELRDYSEKFKEVSKQNGTIIKNYLFSLEKLASLVTDTKHPEVQTVPIISKEATLTYLAGMFNRLKGGMTLLIPSIDDIPVDLILATKNHQRISLVTALDPNVHLDLLKRLLQKPNVRVRTIESHKFEGVEGYIAADRDAEEVLIGVKEDQGETIAIASQADSFIVLMGKIVLGDYFLARSQEITRSQVGL